MAIPGTGIFEDFAWDPTAVAPGVPASGLSILTGGDTSIDADGRDRVGAAGRVIGKGGVLKLGGSADFYVTVQENDLIQAAFRASYPSGLLTDMMFWGGMDSWGLLYRNAVIDSLGLTYAEGEGLKASMAYSSLDVEASDAGIYAGAPSDDFEDWEFVITTDAGEIHVVGFGANLTNNVSYRRSANTPPTIVRAPNVRFVGIEMNSGDLTTLQPLPLADTGLIAAPLPHDRAIALSGLNGIGDTCVINITGARYETHSAPTVDSNTGKEWKYTWRSAAGGLAVALTPVAPP